MAYNLDDDGGIPPSAPISDSDRCHIWQGGNSRRTTYEAIWSWISGHISSGGRAFSVTSFGAIRDNATDNTTAVNDCYAAAIAGGGFVYWPEGTYLCTGQTPNVTKVRSRGPGILNRNNTNSLKFENHGFADSVEVHISPLGSDTNDGLTADTPLQTVAAAWNALCRLGDGAASAKFKLVFAAGTHEILGAVGLRYWTGAPNARIVWQGPERNYAEPTAKIDCSSNPDNSAIETWYEINGINIRFDNILLFGQSGGPAIQIASSGSSVDVNNLWVKDSTRGIHVRRSSLRGDGCHFQNIEEKAVYVHSSGASLGFGNGPGFVFNTCGVGVDFSRMSTGYVVDSTFTGCKRNATISHNSRMRTQRNSFGAVTVAGNPLVNVDRGGVWSRDTDNPDTFPGASLGSPALITEGSAVIEHFDQGKAPAVHAHMFTGFKDTWSGRIEGTGRQNVANVLGEDNLSPFRGPKWTFSHARVCLKTIVHFEYGGSGNTPTIQLSGDSSSADSVLGEVIMEDSTPGDRQCVVEFLVYGPGDDGMGSSITTCHVDTGDSGKRSLFIKHRPTINFNRPDLFSNANEYFKWRLYVENSNPSGTVNIVSMRSELTI